MENGTNAHKVALVTIDYAELLNDSIDKSESIEEVLPTLQYKYIYITSSNVLFSYAAHLTTSWSQRVTCEAARALGSYLQADNAIQ